MHSTRRIAAVVLSAVFFGAGCSDGPDRAPLSEAVRTVQTSIGEVAVPENVESVVVLEGRRDLDIVLSLDLPLVGYPVQTRVMDMRAPLADALASVGDADGIFSAGEISLEAIAAANPTVIVGRITDVQPILDDLRAIAPVIPVGAHGEGGTTWQEDLKIVAAATGTEAAADRVLAEYDARVARVGQDYAEQIAGTSVVPVGYSTDGTEVETARLQSVVLRAVGAVPSRAFAAVIDSPDGEATYGAEATFDTYSDAGAILVLLDDETELAAANADPLWARLPAVQQGRVFRLDRNSHEGGPITAHAVLDVVEQMYGSL